MTLEDLARANSRHTLNGLMRVVSKVSYQSYYLKKCPYVKQNMKNYGLFQQLCLAQGKVKDQGIPKITFVLNRKLEISTFYILK